ncbi:MAG: TonB-dependent receptor [Pseudomonadota bacterium]
MQRTYLAIALASLPLTPTLAQDIPTLDEIVVTATRTAQTADETLASVTVIGRRQLDQATSLDEALATVPGLDLSRNGGYGKSTSMFLRGANAGHVLVLVDGVRAASATLGTFAFEHLRPEQVERIEIVRGPRAALYGSDAVGGVIQIFTRQARGPYVEAGLGSHDTRSLSAGIGGGDAWRYSLEAGRLTSEGIPTFAVLNGDHGYQSNHLAARLSGPLAPGLRLEADLSQAQGHSEQDPAVGNEDFRNRVASLRLNHDISDAWTQRLTLGHALDDYTTHSPFLPASIVTRRTSLAWQHDLNLTPAGLTTLGLDAWRDQADKDGSGDIHASLDTWAVYAQQQWRGLGSDWSAALRRDHHENYGDKTTGSLAWGRDLTAATRLTAAWGTAFKAPTVNDLFWPYSSDLFLGTTYITVGNPNLKPESSNSLELGLRHKLGDTLVLNANAYRTRVTDLIEWQGTATGLNEFTYTPTNVSKADIQGLELGASGRLEQWRLAAALAFLDAENTGTGEQLDRRPKRKLTVSLGHPLGKGDLQAEWIAASARNDLNATTRLAGYGIVNLAWKHPLPGDLEVQARLENLFDRHYVLASSFSGDYNTFGRSLFVTLRYQPR